MYIDIADERNNLFRKYVGQNGLEFTTGSGQHCYIFSATNYYSPSPQDRQNTNPDSLAPSTTCDYGKPPIEVTIH